MDSQESQHMTSTALFCLFLCCQRTFDLSKQSADGRESKSELGKKIYKAGRKHHSHKVSNEKGFERVDWQ